jgi:predicted TPR repeat methyltransferase
LLSLATWISHEQRLHHAAPFQLHEMCKPAQPSTFNFLERLLCPTGLLTNQARKQASKQATKQASKQASNQPTKN